MPRTSARHPRWLRPAGALALAVSLAAACSGTSASAGPVSLRLQVSMTPGGAGDLPARAPGGRRSASGVRRPARERPAGFGDPEDHDRGRGRRPAGRPAGDGFQRPAMDPPRRVPRPHRAGRRGQARPGRLLRRPAGPVPLEDRAVGHPGQRLPGDRVLRQEGVRGRRASRRRTTPGPTRTCGRLP